MWADRLLLCVVAAHVALAPFTKVEESFSLQATHDVLYHGVDVRAYDHHEFPGVVPRSFAGALLLAAASAPATLLLRALQAPKLAALVVTRLVLGAGLTATFAALRSALSERFGSTVGVAFMLITAAQFHLPFYMSRTLQNTFALAVTNLALAAWVRGKDVKRAVHLLVAATAVLRCDLVLLLAPMGLHLLLTRQLSIVQAVVHGLAALAVSIALTAPVDSFLWGKPLWPELEVLRFNVLDNRSSEWGTSAFHWYFSSALPRALLGAAPLAVLGAALERRLRPQFVSALVYVLLYSALPHKEVRFLFPVLPLFNMCAAAALARLYASRRKSPLRMLMFLAAVALVAASLAAKAVMTWAAYWNYPGGWALLSLHQSSAASACTGSRGPCSVHVDVLPAMSGVTRFGEQAGFALAKTEGLDDAGLLPFKFLLSARSSVPGFALQQAVHGFGRLRLGRPPRLLAVETQPQVYVHARAL